MVFLTDRLSIPVRIMKHSLNSMKVTNKLSNDTVQFTADPHE